MSDPENLAATYPFPDTARIAVTDQVIVRVSGPGTDKFLQGQFSQQIADVNAHSSPRAAACSPKGRAYCLTRMVRDGEDVLMALPESLADETIAHLRKYLMLFRGTSMEPDTEAHIIGLLGESAAGKVADNAAGRIPSPGDTLAVDGGFLVRTMGTAEGVARFELWQTGQLQADTTNALNSLDEENLATWQASEIAAGVPSLCPETREGFVPQMLNWQHLGGVHFKKGCYTGQEVIARMHFLGQLKKSLFRFACPASDQPPVPGMPLVNGDRSVGDIVNSVQLADGSYQCLAVVRHDAADSELGLKPAPEIRLTKLSLPYAVPEREQAASSDT
ncbi:CAF17-like 4Fe-4S cluster assembly/insertion protein YgfZ [Marinobacter confluentis]|uniref:Folate-binding protein n=1 Tax=Marinobacter confluentis TaxID=1697557 RepID=A0A4Z1BLY5_9GAMM|nr:folate-binding protein YgfZ [Marinobacter confluentis]TGN41037.1 folate-binding protein [Marinobacter confluentis]